MKQAGQRLTTAAHWQIETGDTEVATPLCLEFLYESLAGLRLERRFGQGVLLSTAHSVKGMEFGHVFILDGGWKAQSLEEERRLLYVAMTRAKETLCLLQRADMHNPFLQEIHSDCLLTRDAPQTLQDATPTVQRRYAVLGMQDIYLGYAAHFPEDAAVHQRLNALKAGDRVILLREQQKVAVKFGDVIIAMLSQQAADQWRDTIDDIETATVIAMVRRYRDDSDEEYRAACRVKQWEVPLLEVGYRCG